MSYDILSSERCNVDGNFQLYLTFSWVYVDGNFQRHFTFCMVMSMEIFNDFFRLLMIHKIVSPEISTDIRLLQQNIIDILFASFSWDRRWLIMLFDKFLSVNLRCRKFKRNLKEILQLVFWVLTLQYVSCRFWLNAVRYMANCYNFLDFFPDFQSQVSMYVKVWAIVLSSSLGLVKIA